MLGQFLRMAIRFVYLHLYLAPAEGWGWLIIFISTKRDISINMIISPCYHPHCSYPFQLSIVLKTMLSFLYLPILIYVASVVMVQIHDEVTRLPSCYEWSCTLPERTVLQFGSSSAFPATPGCPSISCGKGCFCLDSAGAPAAAIPASIGSGHGGLWYGDIKIRLL